MTEGPGTEPNSASRSTKPQCVATSKSPVVESPVRDIYQIRTHAPGATGSLPLTADMLVNSPSGDLFGLSQNVGMGWNPRKQDGDSF